jgi:hypothetical protein
LHTKGLKKIKVAGVINLSDMGSMRQRKQIADRMDSIVRKIHWIVLFTIRIGGTLGIL